MSIVYFPVTAWLWNSLLTECIPLTYDINGFKSRINMYLLFVGSFETDFVYVLIFCTSFSCNSMPHSGCSALYQVNPN